MAEPVEHPKAQGGDIQISSHPMLRDLVELDKAVRSTNKRIEKQAHQIYKDLTGIDLPKLMSYRDEEGALWELNVLVRLRLVERASTGEVQ